MPSPALDALRLAFWLGPWAGARAPRRIAREVLTLAGARPIRAAVYRARREPRGVYLISPGLHYAGPDDPRFDRFCRVLAAAGFVVVAPFLPDFLTLRVAATATDDLATGLAHATAIARRESLGRPTVFSISFGSMPAIELCAREEGRDVGALVLFGGFCDFATTVRFAVTGRATHRGEHLVLPHDRLNAPVVHLNLLGRYPTDLDEAATARAIDRMVRATWGKNELKRGDARRPQAIEAAAREGLGEPERRFFFAACGLEPGGEAMLDDGLARAGEAFAFTDPRPHLARIHPPVVIVHGKDDDVIPWFEAEKLAEALPPGHPHEVVLTGLYGHTGAMLPGPRTIAAELAAMARVVRVLAASTTRRA